MMLYWTILTSLMVGALSQEPTDPPEPEMSSLTDPKEPQIESSGLKIPDDSESVTLDPGVTSNEPEMTPDSLSIPPSYDPSAPPPSPENAPGAGESGLPPPLAADATSGDSRGPLIPSSAAAIDLGYPTSPKTLSSATVDIGGLPSSQPSASAAVDTSGLAPPATAAAGVVSSGPSSSAANTVPSGQAVAASEAADSISGPSQAAAAMATAANGSATASSGNADPYFPKVSDVAVEKGPDAPGGANETMVVAGDPRSPSAAAIAFGVKPIIPEPREVCPSRLAGAIDSFSFRLFKALMNPENKNIVFSPLGVVSTLALAFIGSRGHTKQQIKQVAEFDKFQLALPDSDREYVSINFTSLIESLNKVNPDYTFYFGNRVFLQKDYAVTNLYMVKVKAWYKSSVQNLDFVKDGPGAIAEINKWVANATSNQMPILLDQPFQNPPKLVLVSVVYFRGLWETPFPRERTAEGAFYLTDGSAITAQLMTATSDFHTLDDHLTKFKFLQMDYKGKNLSMLVALPGPNKTPLDLEMTPDTFCRVVGAMRPSPVTVVLPRFRIKMKVELKEPFVKMNLTSLFDAANLTLSDKPLSVDSVLHQAAVEVSEEGRSPPAPLAVSVGTPLEFRADHPFLFYVIDNRNKLILFSGRMDDPTRAD